MAITIQVKGFLQIQALPMGFIPTAPGPFANTRGIKPAINANEVIKIGRNRALAPLMAASKTVAPWFFFCTANSTINTAFLPNNPSTPEFPLISGQSHKFDIPKFAQHKEISWSVGNLEVQIGAIKPTNSEKVNKFNQLILDIFNTASGNMLSEGNILYWNVWFTAPEEVKQKEWKKHAELWRKSISNNIKKI